MDLWRSRVHPSALCSKTVNIKKMFNEIYSCQVLLTYTIYTTFTELDKKKKKKTSQKWVVHLQC